MSASQLLQQLPLALVCSQQHKCSSHMLFLILKSQRLLQLLDMPLSHLCRSMHQSLCVLGTLVAPATGPPCPVFILPASETLSGTMRYEGWRSSAISLLRHVCAASSIEAPLGPCMAVVQYLYAQVTQLQSCICRNCPQLQEFTEGNEQVIS